MNRFNEKSALTLALLAFAGVMLFSTLGLSPAARVVPLAVLVPTLALLICELVLDLAPDFVRGHSSIQQIEHKDIFGIERLRGRVPKEEPASGVSRRRTELEIIAWLLMMLSLIYTVGLLAALPLFCLFYLKVRAKESWLLAICMAGAMLGFLYGVFIFLLNIPLA